MCLQYAFLNKECKPIDNNCCEIAIAQVTEPGAPFRGNLCNCLIATVIDMVRCILLLVKQLISPLFAFSLLAASLPMFALTDQSVTVKKSTVTHGSVLVEAESDGKPVELDCDLGSKPCSAPVPGDYVMVGATTEGIYNDCTNIILYKATSSGEREKVGVYCWLNDGQCYMGACDGFAQSATQTDKRSEVSNFVSPDGSLAVAIVSTKGAESRVEIQDAKRTALCAHDFSSPDGQHGYGVDAAEWTLDSQFVVFRLRNSGGHMPCTRRWCFSRGHRSCRGADAIRR